MQDINTSFSLNRLLLLIRYSLWQDWRIFGLSSLVFILAFIVLGPFFSLFGAHDLVVQMEYYIALGLGWLYTSAILAEAHQKQRAPRFLMFPASSAEKLAARWLITAIAYPMAVILIGMLFHQATYHFHTLKDVHVEVNGVPKDIYHREWSLFPEVTWNSLITYLVIQSVFFWGAVHFSSHAFIKTLLCVLGCSLLIELSAGLLHNRIIVNGAQMWPPSGDLPAAKLVSWLDTGFKPALFFILPFVLLPLSYRSFKRIEA